MDQSGGTAAMAKKITISGATVYMTKAAIAELVTELHRVAAAEPEECYEVHLGMFFSRFDKDDLLHEPPVLFSDGLGPVVQAMREAELRKDIVSGEVEEDATITPFEITLMHVPAKIIQQMTESVQKS